jgi:hypothetical protein
MENSVKREICNHDDVHNNDSTSHNEKTVKTEEKM